MLSQTSGELARPSADAREVAAWGRGAAGADSALAAARGGEPARQAQCKWEINKQNKGKYSKLGHVPCVVTCRCADCAGRINGPETEGLCSAAGCFSGWTWVLFPAGHGGPCAL